MAIKVAGTTVIDDSRVLQNLGSALTVSNGGTSSTTLTANNILVGNGTSAFQVIAPGTSGNVLTSNGTNWYSAAAAAGGGGSGLFNTSISIAAGYAITTSMANAYAAAATAGYRYIVHSLHVTNIDGTTQANVFGQIVGGTGTYSNITFANNVPVPAGSAVELFKKPKILQPGDYIQLQANASSDLHATITLESSTDTKYFGAGLDLTTATMTDLYTMTANSVIESVLLSNDSTVNDVKATVVWTDGSNNIQGYFAFELIVPMQATVEVLEMPKFVQSGYKVRVQSNQADRLEAIISGKTV